MKMTIEELNQRYGAPGRIVFHQGFAGFPNVVLANKYGSAEVALFGANVLSYRPTGHGPVLFRPAKKDAEYKSEDSFHGGIPVCFPMFGNRLNPALPQHGFARKRLFEVRKVEYTEEKTEIVLGIKSDDETRALWKHEFDFEVMISVSMKLNFALKAKNTDKEPWQFSAGFHPYFLIGDRNQLVVRGLDGCDFKDASGEEIVDGHQTGDLAMTKGYDHIFQMKSAPKHEYALLDQRLKRAIAEVAAGNDCTIVWNPDTAYVVEDHTAEDWKKFVCVEPVSDWPGGRTLKSGETYELHAAVQAHLE